MQSWSVSGETCHWSLNCLENMIRLNYSAAFWRHFTQWLQCAQKALLYTLLWKKANHPSLHCAWVVTKINRLPFILLWKKRVHAKDISYWEYLHWQRSSVPSHSCIDLPHEEHSLHSYSVICHQCIPAVVSHERSWLERMLPLSIMRMLPTQHFAI